MGRWLPTQPRVGSRRRCRSEVRGRYPRLRRIAGGGGTRLPIGRRGRPSSNLHAPRVDVYAPLRLPLAWHALTCDPGAEPVAIDGAGRGDACVTVEFDVLDEPGETFLPLVGECVPRPAGQLVEPPLAIGAQDAFGVLGALLDDPSTEPVATNRIGRGNVGVAVDFDVVQQSAKTVLPLVGLVGSQCPVGQVLESVLAVWR